MNSQDRSRRLMRADRTLFYAMATLLFLLTSACVGQDQAADHRAQLEKSLQTWQKLKKECSGNYSYRVRWSSFTGFGHETIVVVQRNKVVERRFIEFHRRRPAAPPAEAGKQADPGGWVEGRRELGAHKQGAAAVTLDKLYEQAVKVLEKDLAPNTGRYLRFNQQGLLLSCFDVDRRIADDAPRRGVVISGIELSTGKPGRRE